MIDPKPKLNEMHGQPMPASFKDDFLLYWSLLAMYARSKPFLLAGGLNAGDQKLDPAKTYSVRRGADGLEAMLQAALDAVAAATVAALRSLRPTTRASDCSAGQSWMRTLCFAPTSGIASAFQSSLQFS